MSRSGPSVTAQNRDLLSNIQLAALQEPDPWSRGQGHWFCPYILVEQYGDLSSG